MQNFRRGRETLLISGLIGAAIAGAAMAGHHATNGAHDGNNGDGAAAEVIELTEGLAVRRVGIYGRRPFHIDLIQSAIVTGQWTTPEEGDEIELPRGGDRTWDRIEVDDRGRFRGRALRGGYVSITVERDEPGVMMLDARGHRMVYVNGRPRIGDIYNLGMTQVPVHLNEGSNELLFHCTRGRLEAKLVKPAGDAFFSETDLTKPDALVGEPVDQPIGVIVVNASDEPLRGAVIRADVGGEQSETSVPTIAPMTIYKAPVSLDGPEVETPDGEEGEIEVDLELRINGEAAHSMATSLDIRSPDETHSRTFISGIDGSVQYYSVVPARADEGDDVDPGLVLTLHGASVEATSQANAYTPKDWTHIVAPTNRRPFGFDWEDWGRRDAMEVLDLAGETFDHDPQRVYLTGHSMGGHGTWHVGAMFPDRFAAIAPSAGWISFWSYSSAAEYDDPDPIEALLARATNASDTLAHRRNYRHHGVYMLHGDEDETVPVDEARTMRETLSAFHTNFAYYERPGAEHWWGSQSVDWPPLFDFLRHNTRDEPADREAIEFHTSNPGISAQSGWATIIDQHRILEMSSIDLRQDADERLVSGETENVRRLTLDLSHFEPGEPVTIEIDEHTIEDARPDEDGKLHLIREQADGEWSAADPPDDSDKGPQRYGTFKAAFDHDALLVYGTQGSDEANEWARRKATYDAEVFWYRGNGAFDVMADTDFNADEHPNRSIVLYGNRETNGAWSQLLEDSPVDVSSDGVRVEDRAVEGEDLASLFVRPREDCTRSLVAVVGGTTPAAMRATDRLPYFVSGVGYPDFICFTPEVLRRRESAVQATGYFGPDWSVESGEFAWDADRDDSDADSNGDNDNGCKTGHACGDKPVAGEQE